MINIIVKLAATKNKRFNVDPTITVGDFKKLIVKEEGAEGVKLVYKAKPLNNDSVTLSDVGVTNNCTMFAALRVIGGTSMGKNVNKYKGNVVNMVTSNCIFGASEGCYEPSIKKLKLECGCIFCPECLRMIIKRQSNHHWEIMCGSSHGTKIPLEVALSAAGYSDAEKDSHQVTITENWMLAGPSGIKVCPNAKCGSFIYRRCNLGNVNRVRCLSCKAYEFCWFCLQKWVGSGTNVCGNDHCDLLASYAHLLQYSPKKRILGIANIPETRLCVNLKCCAMNTHIKGSKDMVCPHCRTHYCQSCLNIWGKGCNRSKHCVPAGTQEITNEMYNVMK